MRVMKLGQSDRSLCTEELWVCFIVGSFESSATGQIKIQKGRIFRLFAYPIPLN